MEAAYPSPVSPISVNEQTQHRPALPIISADEAVTSDLEVTPHSDEGSVETGVSGGPPTVTNDEIEEKCSVQVHEGVLRIWWQELMASIMSVVALVALIVTLFAFRNKPSPDWPHWLSINVIISIYVVTIKSGVLLIASNGLGQLKWSWFMSKTRLLNNLVTYDNASRGPVGSIVLLWMLKISDLLSSLGALVTILSIAVDPFAQQIVHYSDCRVPSSDLSAAIPRTNFVDTSAFAVHETSGTLTVAAQNAILSGVYNPNPYPRFDCSSGNCTWTNSYSTLAWCSSCSDVSHLVTFSNSGNNTLRNTTLFLPNPHLGLSTYVTNDSLEDFTAVAMGQTDFLQLVPDMPGYSTSIDFLFGQRGNSDLFTGQPWPPCTGNTTDWSCQGYGATRCRLFPCAKTFSGHVQGRQTSETQIDQSSDWGIGTGNRLLGLLDLHCVSPASASLLQKQGYRFTPDQRWLTYNFTLESAETSGSDSCLYAFPLTLVEAIEGYLVNTLAGTLGVEAGFAGSPKFTGAAILQPFYAYGDVTFGSVEGIFGNISTGFTNYIRGNGAAGNSTPAGGTVMVERSCIGIRWGWIAYPAALVWLAMVFLGFSLRAVGPSKRMVGRAPVWKSSPLALLYRGFSGGDDGGNVDPVSLRGMEKRAGVTHVRLEEGDDDSMRLNVRSSGDQSSKQ